MIKSFLIFLLSTIIVNAFIGTGISISDDLIRMIKLSKNIKLSKVNLFNNFIKNPNSYLREFNTLSKKQKIDFLSEIAVQKGLIKPTQQLYYINKFSKLESGDKILLSAIQNGKDIKKIIITRRITKFEKSFLFSKESTKINIFGRTVIRRSVYQCSKSNISLMLKGNSPIGLDNKRVNLHHLKQQKHGILVEMTETEHNRGTKILHRYTQISDVNDRQNKFKAFRSKYWKSQAIDCISKSKK